jgi:pimeloyl-ACP methyl ester carboxylesterase
MERIIEVEKRKFGIYEYGIESGPVVFYFHGFPGSRLDGFLFDFDTVAGTSGHRIIAVDRPGIGNSDFINKRRLQDWVTDVSNIADYLKIDKFSVLGISGGAPYALSIAHGLHERLHSVSIVSGMGPFQYKESKIGSAMMIPKLSAILRRIIVWFMRLGITGDPEKFRNRIVSTLPASDSKYLISTGKIDAIVTAFQESLKQGLKGYLHEAKIYKGKWGFDIKSIKSKVYLWHGVDDRNVSIKLAKRIGSEIPGCQAKYIENEGHFSLPGKYLLNILTEIKNNYKGT